MRNTIQSKLNELINIDAGDFIPDGMIEEGTTYFGYSIQENHSRINQDKKRVLRYSIIGYVVRKEDNTENTLLIVDNATKDIVNKLIELNFKVDSKDINLSNGIRKKEITGYVYYDETNDKLVF